MDSGKENGRAGTATGTERRVPSTEERRTNGLLSFLLFNFADFAVVRVANFRRFRPLAQTFAACNLRRASPPRLLLSATCCSFSVNSTSSTTRFLVSSILVSQPLTVHATTSPSHPSDSLHHRWAWRGTRFTVARCRVGVQLTAWPVESCRHCVGSIGASGVLYIFRPHETQDALSSERSMRALGAPMSASRS